MNFFLRTFCSLGLLVFCTTLSGQDKLRFEVVENPFPIDQKNLKKWDSPTIADLDQDGWPDLLLNDHGYGLRVMWNNAGRFAKPYDLLMGDIHGVSVADFDRDGKQEIILSRGGGSGSNARNAKIMRVDRDRNFTDVPEFPTPFKTMRGRTIKFVDLNNDGGLDLLNFAFPGRGAKLSENYLYGNDGEGRLILEDTLKRSFSDGQKTLLTDYNNDGITDLFLYGHGDLRVFEGGEGYELAEVSATVLPGKINGVSSAVEFDYDNDGDFDVYLARSRYFEPGETFYDPETQLLGYFIMRGKVVLDNLPAGNVIEIENYLTAWPNNDLRLGETGYKHTFPDEMHIGRNIRMVNSDAIGFPDETTEKGGYLGFIGNGEWRLSLESWSPATGVIRGVKAYPAYNHPEEEEGVLLENRGGKFVEATSSMGLTGISNTASVAVADFNNDGWQDLLLLPRGDLVRTNHSQLYLNQAGKGFARSVDHQILTDDLGSIGMGITSLDYDDDGNMDVLLCNERGRWHLFKNTTTAPNGGKHYKVTVMNSPSGKATALGAVVEITANGTTQRRRVGATSAAYSNDTNPYLHFGLGGHAGPVTLSVRWTNGEAITKTTGAGERNIEVGSR